MDDLVAQHTWLGTKVRCEGEWVISPRDVDSLSAVPVNKSLSTSGIL